MITRRNLLLLPMMPAVWSFVIIMLPGSTTTHQPAYHILVSLLKGNDNLGAFFAMIAIAQLVAVTWRRLRTVALSISMSSYTFLGVAFFLGNPDALITVFTLTVAWLCSISLHDSIEERE